MTLRNLLITGQLAEHETDAVQVRRMLLAAQRSIDDAKEETINASHFECSGRSFGFS